MASIGEWSKGKFLWCWEFQANPSGKIFGDIGNLSIGPLHIPASLWKMKLISPFPSLESFGGFSQPSGSSPHSLAWLTWSSKAGLPDSTLRWSLPAALLLSTLASKSPPFKSLHLPVELRAGPVVTSISVGWMNEGMNELFILLAWKASSMQGKAGWKSVTIWEIGCRPPTEGE